MFNSIFFRNTFAGILLSSISLSSHAAGGVDEFGMEDHSATCKYADNYQNLSVSDFDGDGFVTPADILLISSAIDDYKRNGKKAYQAFYDIVNPIIGENGVTENTLDASDLAKAKSDLLFSMFRRPSALDREVAAQYQFTKRYRDINKAILDGYAPFTQEYENHGIHLLKMPKFDSAGNIIENVIDGKFDPAKPEGLNYDRYGNLVGVFYVIGPDLKRLMAGDTEHYNDWLSGNYAKLMAETDANGNPLNDLMVMGNDSNGNPIIRPIGFSNDGNDKVQDHWHFHQSMCERNAWTVYNKFQQLLVPKAAQGTLTFDEVFAVAQEMDTRQCDLDKPCKSYMSKQPDANGDHYPDGLSIPRFFMLHTWVYNANNRCGTMWGSHEDISFNDLNPDGTLTDEEVQALRDSIAAERLSFVLQPQASLLDGTTIANKNYRRVCLNTNFIGKIDTYENARAILRGEDITLDGTLENYQTLGFTADQIIETLICQPKVTGEPLDTRCAAHPNDK